MIGEYMRRREFITVLGGAAAAWPLSARAQQPGDRKRLIALLMGGSASDPLWQANAAVVRESLAKMGWIEGLNLRVELRFGEGDADSMRAQARELVRLAPEAILATTGAAARALQQETKSIPIVVAAAGPEEDSAVALVKNIARPEGNMTAFPILFYSVGGKWVELLKEAAPAVARVALVFNPDTFTAKLSGGYFDAINAAAQVLGVKTVNISFEHAADLDSAISAFPREPNGGLIILPGAATSTRDVRQSVLLLAARHRLPAIQWTKSYPADGGLMSYGSDYADMHRRAAGYIDRLLRGAKVSELPVQYPTKFDLVVNLKAANAIGLTIPETFLVRADQVIE